VSRPPLSAEDGCHFNESQQRYVLSRLRHLEETLTEAVEQLAPCESGRVFRTVSADANTAQRKVLADYLAQLRFALRRFMLAQQLRDELRPTRSLWAFQTALVFARIAAEELRPKYWRGYGEVDPGAARAAERFAAELVTLLHRMEDYVAGGEGGGLAARLEQLAGTGDEVRLLKELERIISAYGLTELRAPLQALVDRAISPRFEIAVFGRVSSGKSSLLNWWLGRELLPTGITPVTAVPTRIVRGETARVRIERAQGSPLEVPVEEIAAYVSEQGNPGNVKHVLSVTLEAPSARLEGGIRLVDTPGLGSLATQGAAKTLEYLPQCDLGILLIEAGAPVAPDDVDVARALLDGGSDLIMVLSKADRLGHGDLELALEYVKAQFEAQLSIPVPLRAISTIAGNPLAQAWFDEMLAPRLASHTGCAVQALGRKIAVLRESVVAILEARLRRPEEEPRPASAPVTNEAARLHERIAQARSEFEHARSQLLDLKRALGRFDSVLLEAAEEELARCWLESARAEESIVVRIEAAMLRHADEPGHAVVRMLESLRDDLVNIIRGAQSESPKSHASEADHGEREAERELARPRGRPVFDISAALAARPSLLPPRAMPRWSIIARPLARARLRGAIATSLLNQLTVHAEALYHWSVRYLDDLTRRFDAAVAMLESAERFGAESPLTPEMAKRARRDLDRLRQWPADAA
jgi:GTP-binding protein EngB required for normal cell division